MGELEILICLSCVSLFNASKPDICFRVLQEAKFKKERLVRELNADMSVRDVQPCKFKEERLVRELNADMSVSAELTCKFKE